MRGERRLGPHPRLLRACLLFDGGRHAPYASIARSDHCSGVHRHGGVAVEYAYRPLGYAVQ